MATRIEKKFKRNTICTMNKMLQELSENLKNNKKISKGECELSKKIIKTIDDFYSKNGISDKEIEDAVNAK